jgi:hypothetical protein
MLHYNYGIAQVAQILQGFDQLLIIPLMQPYAGFIQNVKYPYQLSANLRSQADALGFSSRQSIQRTIERQIGKTYIQHKTDALANFFQYFSGDYLLAFVGCAVGGIPIEKTVKTIWPFYLALLLALGLVAYVPAMSLWLPQLLN